MFKLDEIAVGFCYDKMPFCLTSYLPIGSAMDYKIFAILACLCYCTEHEKKNLFVDFVFGEYSICLMIYVLLLRVLLQSNRPI